MTEGLGSLLVISMIAALVPLIVGLLHIRVAQVVLLLVAGVVFGPEMMDWIHVDAPIELLSELGLGMLFFLAGLELEQRAVQGPSGKLAAFGWFVSLAVAFVLVFAVALTGRVIDTIAVAIALTSTALGTLLPTLRDSRMLNTWFGTLFMGAGAWGEFGPIIAMSVLLSTKSSVAALLTLLLFGIVVLFIAAIPSRFATEGVKSVLARGHRTSSQTPVRFTMLLIIALLTLAGSFGLDVVLGAFVAGMIVRRYAPPSEEANLEIRVEAIAYGFLIPIFFVVSGATLDIRSIIENPLRLLTFFVLMLLVRGLPQFFIYRRAIRDVPRRMQFSLLVATGLPFIVAITSLEVDAGVMQTSTAAALVGAGALSVLAFPLAGTWLTRAEDAQDLEENTA